MKKYKRLYYKVNRLYIIKKTKEYKKRHPIKTARTKHIYYLKNRSKIYKRIIERKKDKNFRESLSKNSRLWRKKHPIKSKLIAINANAKRKKYTSMFKMSVAQWNEVKRKNNFRCFYCLLKKKLTVDHYIPLSRGGKHCLKNIVPACLNCNCRKRNMLPSVFFKRLYV